MAASESDRWPQAAPESDFLIPGPGMTALQHSAHAKSQDPPPAMSGQPDVEPAVEKASPWGDLSGLSSPVPGTNGDTPDRTAAAPDPVTASRPELPPYLRDELAPILAAAQESAAQIIERARAEVLVERGQLARAREQLELSLAEVASWRKNIEPVVRAFHERIAEMQSRMTELPELIRSGLDPLATTVASMDPALTAMTAASEELLNLGTRATP